MQYLSYNKSPSLLSLQWYLTARIFSAPLFFFIFGGFSFLQEGEKLCCVCWWPLHLKMSHFQKSVSAGEGLHHRDWRSSSWETCRGDPECVFSCTNNVGICLPVFATDGVCVCICLWVCTCHVRLQTNSAAANYSDRKISLFLFSHQYNTFFPSVTALPLSPLCILVFSFSFIITSSHLFLQSFSPPFFLPLSIFCCYTWGFPLCSCFSLLLSGLSCWSSQSPVLTLHFAANTALCL